MAVKSAGQFSFVEALAPQLASGGGRLDRLHGLVKWYRFEKVLVTLRDGGSGRPAYPPLLMFKVLLLQSFSACGMPRRRRLWSTGCRSAASWGWR